MVKVRAVVAEVLPIPPDEAELTAGEISLTLEVLEREYLDLKSEVRHTDSSDFKAELKEREAKLLLIISKLRAIDSSVGTETLG